VDLRVAENIAIMIVEPNEARVWSALSLACASSALGNTVSLFFSGASVRQLDCNYKWETELNHIASGVPTVAELFETACQSQIDVFVCQSGLSMCNLESAQLIQNAQPYGMIGWLAENKTAQLLII
jgi:predicted peroxiredoxin